MWGIYDGLEARSTQTVDHQGWNRDWDASPEASMACQVGSILCCLENDREMLEVWFLYISLCIPLMVLLPQMDFRLHASLNLNNYEASETTSKKFRIQCAMEDWKFGKRVHKIMTSQSVLPTMNKHEVMRLSLRQESTTLHFKLPQVRHNSLTHSKYSTEDGIWDKLYPHLNNHAC